MKPVRTCVGCRQRTFSPNLLRVLFQDDRLVFDFAKKMPGRGAWLHPVSDCLDLAISRRAFARALRISGSFDASGLKFTTEQAETMLAKK